MALQPVPVAGLRRHRRDHGPLPTEQVEVVERGHHRDRMIDRRGSVTRLQRRFARSRVHHARRGRVLAVTIPRRVVAHPYPQHEIPHLAPLRTTPLDPQSQPRVKGVSGRQRLPWIGLGRHLPRP
jgi:hypothetical protein